MTATVSMNWSSLGSLRPFPVFQPDKDVSDLQAAFEQKDVRTVVRILTSRSNDQRQILAQTYRSVTQQDLRVRLETVLDGGVKVLILGLMMTPNDFEAQRLRQAMEGLGTDEETLLEIMCLRSAEQLSDIAAVYTKEYQRDLEKDLTSETSGDLRQLLLALLKMPVSGNVDQDVRVLCEELNNSKADVKPWLQILTMRDPDHLRSVLIHLEAERGQTVTAELEKHFGLLDRDIRLGLQVLVSSIEDPHLYLAQRIQPMKESVVQGVIVSHSEEDLLAVRVAFKKKTGRSLYSTIQDTFEGDIQQILLALCRSED
ncbi:annexin A2 isoform X2 [Tachysurus fulvidraco]|uniref:annexin A2 isoform X2 n=1 Tax=Tachysurus fulvidraco TaxID=1234273 RepID=UPI001FF03CCF|nr:annexin A2 isoform X2 [Tachysurus fulvidraco]